MRTDDFRPSENVEDNREASASRGRLPGGAGGLGIGTVVIIGLISWYFGIDPSVLLNGAQILTGGNRRPDIGPNFLEPAVVTRVDHSMQLMRDETFGPVMAIRPVASADEAVELANDSPFGLSASVWTRDSRRGKNIAHTSTSSSTKVKNDVAA